MLFSKLNFRKSIGFAFRLKIGHWKIQRKMGRPNKTDFRNSFSGPVFRLFSDGLNPRGIPTARGGKLSAVQVDTRDWTPAL
jgi:hypothetical protein